MNARGPAPAPAIPDAPAGNRTAAPGGGGTPWTAGTGTSVRTEAGAAGRGGARGGRDRILFHAITDPAKPGGVEAVLEKVIAAARADGHAAVEVRQAPKPGGDAELCPLFLRDDPRRRLHLPSLARVARLLVRHRPRTVNVHFITSETLYFVLLRRLFGYRLVLSAHGSDIRLPDPKTAPLLPRILRGADAITVVSDEMRQRVLALPGIDPARVLLVPNGIDHRFWTPSPGPEEADAPHPEGQADAPAPPVTAPGAALPQVQPGGVRAGPGGTTPPAPPQPDQSGTTPPAPPQSDRSATTPPAPPQLDRSGTTLPALSQPDQSATTPPAPPQRDRSATAPPAPPQPVRGGAAARIVAAGRLEPVKGFDLLIDAFAAIAPRHPGARLVLCGDGAERGALGVQAQARGVADRVEFAGFLGPEGLRAQYRAADLFVLSSRSEGFPIALLEAMATGLPFVAADVGGVGEIATPETGITVPPEDADALAEALDRMLARRSDPACAAAARARACDFTLDRTLKGYRAAIAG